jgi:hypothetical protein
LLSWLTLPLCSSKNSVNFHQTTRLHIPEDITLHSYHCENLKSHFDLEVYLCTVNMKINMCMCVLIYQLTFNFEHIYMIVFISSWMRHCKCDPTAGLWSIIVSSFRVGYLTSMWVCSSLVGLRSRFPTIVSHEFWTKSLKIFSGLFCYQRMIVWYSHLFWTHFH